MARYALALIAIVYAFFIEASEFNSGPYNEFGDSAVWDISHEDDFSYPKGYERSPYVDLDIWQSIYPFLLPEDHPIKPVLDKIFSQERVTLNKKTLKKAGFEDIIEGQYSHAIVAKHRKLQGYLVKLYTDEYIGLDEWSQFQSRILGSLQLKQSIDKHGYNNLFKVPRKWIYPLPANPSPPENCTHRNFILVVEDMKVLSRKVNEGQWRSQHVTKKLLDALYIILEENGLLDGAMPENAPFSNDGKIAFIDTEHCNVWPVRYVRLNRHLTESMAQYWISITHQ